MLRATGILMQKCTAQVQQAAVCCEKQSPTGALNPLTSLDPHTLRPERQHRSRLRAALGRAPPHLAATRQGLRTVS